MAKSKGSILVDKLEEAFQIYMSAIASIEDNKVDSKSKTRACGIIEKSQIHEQIALEQIQG